MVFSLVPTSPLEDLLQGSPVSLILFLLFTAPLHKLPLRNDVGLLDADPTQEHFLCLYKHGLGLTSPWTEINRLSFDPSKSELIHFDPILSKAREKPGLLLSLPGHGQLAVLAAPKTGTSDGWESTSIDASSPAIT